MVICFDMIWNIFVVQVVARKGGISRTFTSGVKKWFGSGGVGGPTVSMSTANLLTSPNSTASVMHSFLVVVLFWLNAV